MQVYLDKDGKYHNHWSHRELIPTEENLRWFAMLDAAADDKGFARFDDVQVQGQKIGVTTTCQRRCDRTQMGEVVMYWIPGSGNYVGDK